MGPCYASAVAKVSRSPNDSSPTAPSGKARRGAKKGRRRSVLDVDEPQRSCIVCRATANASTMLRFARGPDGTIGFDIAQRLPGRGAWVCAQARCVDKAVEPKAGFFVRAFDAPCLVGGASLAADVRTLLRRDVLSRLGLLRRAGTLVLGRDEVVRRRDELALCGFADDLSAGSRHEVGEQLDGRAMVRFPPMAEVGAAVGTRPVGVVGVCGGGGAARALARALERWSAVEASGTGPAPAAERDGATEKGR
jgi:predicted RNA-binding protein YlxR (DUF448 family)